MARYQEKVLSLTPTVLLLVFSFIIAFAPWTLNDRELSWREAYLIVQAEGVKFTPLAVVTVHSEAIPTAQPLLPMLARAVTELGCPAELSTRVLSLAGLLGMALLVFLVTYRTRSSIASGACAAAMLITSLLTIDKSSIGSVVWLFALVILGGHLLWYYFAALRGDWTKAWLVGFTACAVGFYLNGIMALIFFIVPLVFMRRPLGIFSKLGNRGLMLGVWVLFLTILLWYLPYHFEGIKAAQVYPGADFFDSGDYLVHLLTFPWDMLLRLMPWALLAWAPFCVAFQTLDSVPMFSRFLRTLFLADFFLLWIMPLDNVPLWMMLIPPAAIMTGLNYELTVRRYGNTLRKMANFMAMVILPVSAALLLGFFLLPGASVKYYLELENPVSYSDNFADTMLAVVAGIMLLITAAILWKMREKPPIWSYFLILSMGPLLVYYSIIFPYKEQDQPRRERAFVLAQALAQDGVPEETVIYKYALNNFFSESVYMNYKIVNITSFSELPQSEKQDVYLLAGSYPNYPERSWKSLLPVPLNVNNQRVNLWRGQWQEHRNEAPERSPLLDEINRPAGRGWFNE